MVAMFWYEMMVVTKRIFDILGISFTLRLLRRKFKKKFLIKPGDVRDDLELEIKIKASRINYEIYNPNTQ